MQVDRYTKSVLTVIAGCLLWICVMTGGSRLAAQPAAPVRVIQQADVQPVVIVGTGPLDEKGNVTIRFTDSSRPARTDPTIPVSLPYSSRNPMPAQLGYTPESPLPIEITAVKKAEKTGKWEPLRVAVEDAPTKPR